MDRFDAAEPPDRVSASEPAPRAAPRLRMILAGLAAVAAAPAAVAALRFFPAVQLSETGAWLLPLTAGLAAAAAASGTVLCTARGLRDESPSQLMRAGALGMLAAGLAIASVRAVSDPRLFPDPGLGVTAVLGAELLLFSPLMPAQMDWLRGRNGVVLVVLFGAIEVSLAAALFAAPDRTLAPWLLGAAAVLVALSAIPGPWLPAGLTAAGLQSLAAARVGTLDALPGVMALAAGIVVYGVIGGRTSTPAISSSSALDDQRPRPAPPPPAPAAALATDPAAASLEPRDEADRLARELRGTIVELMQARRTIELQRDELSRAATVDALTGVATRHSILDRLRIEAGGSRRYSHPVAVVLLDVDGFSALNRDHGLAVGDEVLREVALRLRLRLRAADALGRVGADSFLALLPHTDETGAATFADALLELLSSRPLETHDGELTVPVSIGIALMRPGMTLSDDELMAEAEAALASARAAGGNRIAFDRLHGLVRLDDRRRRGGTDESPTAADSTT